MNELLDIVLQAHGGLDRWREVQSLDLRVPRVSLTGSLYQKHFRGRMDHWDPAVTDGFASGRPVILSSHAGRPMPSGNGPTVSFCRRRMAPTRTIG
jgi:hypothetical protein